MKFRDYYNILGLKKDATAHEIRKAYRHIAQKMHPDKTRGDHDKQDKFIEAGEAYEVLRDEKKRNKYDEMYNRSVTLKKNVEDFSESKYDQRSGNFEEVVPGVPWTRFSDFFRHFFGEFYGRDPSGGSSEDHIHYDDLLR